jgi:hypothetical protein
LGPTPSAPRFSREERTRIDVAKRCNDREEYITKVSGGARGRIPGSSGIWRECTSDKRWVRTSDAAPPNDAAENEAQHTEHANVNDDDVDDVMVDVMNDVMDDGARRTSAKKRCDAESVQGSETRVLRARSRLRDKPTTSVWLPVMGLLVGTAVLIAWMLACRRAVSGASRDTPCPPCDLLRDA